jgi:hypothetical protein
MFSKYKCEKLLLLIGLAWLVFFPFVIQLKIGFPFLGDDWSYMQAAKKLYFESAFDEGRPLGIAAIDGFPFLFGFSETAVVKWGILVNIFCWCFSALLIFWLLATRISRKAAFWWALFFIFCIGNLAIVFHLLPESIFISMILSALLFLNKFSLTGKTNFLALAIAILFLAVLVKPVALGLALLVSLFYIRRWLSLLQNKFSRLIVVSLSLIFLQMYGMKKQYGDFTISYIDTITYYNYLGAKADCLRKDTVFIPGENQRAKYFNTFTSHEQKKLVAEDLKNQLWHNTANLAKAYLYCMWSNSSKGSYIVSECKNGKHTPYFDTFHFLFKAVSKIQNMLLTVMGVLLSFYCLARWKKETDFHLLISMMVLYIFFVSAVSCFQCDRFHIVFFPLVVVLGAKFTGNKKADPRESA